MRLVCAFAVLLAAALLPALWLLSPDTGGAAAASGQRQEAPETPILDEEDSQLDDLIEDTGSSKPRTASNRLHLDAEQLRRARSAGLLPASAKSILRVDRELRYGDYIWQDEDAPVGELVVRVDLRRQVISAFRGGHEIGTSVILYGVDGHETPIGTFPIMAMIPDNVSSIYGAPMPYTLRLTTDGVAVHGSDVRYGAATHGCIGVPLEFARLLFDEAEIGDRVEIVRSSTELT